MPTPELIAECRKKIDEIITEDVVASAQRLTVLFASEIESAYQRGRDSGLEEAAVVFDKIAGTYKREESETTGNTYKRTIAQSGAAKIRSLKEQV